MSEFQSTHPVWGATRRSRLPTGQLPNFNPRTPCGVRRADLTICHYGHPISIHAPRVGCDIGAQSLGHVRAISIHAPRVGCDGKPALQIQMAIISIHAPRVGCDGHLSHVCPFAFQFQSTHPVWGATCGISIPCASPLHFNPRTPCGVRPSKPSTGGGSTQFQSTHPVWGATMAEDQEEVGTYGFQSTHPVWGATEHLATHPVEVNDFNPRTPCGVRLFDYLRYWVVGGISIHAPRVGCDLAAPGR